MLKTRTVLLMLVALVLQSISLFGEDTKAIEGRLNAKLHDAVLVLRTPLIGTKLKFDSDGHFRNDVGIRGFDDKFQVSSVELTNAELVLKGVRLSDGYDPSKKRLGPTRVEESVEARIPVPNSTDEEAIAAQYRKVFLGSAEIAERSCSDYGYFESINPAEKKSKKNGNHGSSEEGSQVCVPSGALAWFQLSQERGVKPPRALENPSPDYPEISKTGREQGGVWVAIRVDESGRISDGVLLGGGRHLVRAVTTVLSRWKFQPGEKDGKPVPMLMTLTVNFVGNFRP